MASSESEEIDLIDTPRDNHIRRTSTPHSNIVIKKHHEPPIAEKHNSIFIKFATVLFIIILILILGGCWYDDSSNKSVLQNDKFSFLWYDLLIDINTFTLIGFGFSMTYLRKYGFTSLSSTLLIISYSIPFGLYASEIIDYFFIGKTGIEGRISGYGLSRGIYSSITVLISFGVILGRINPSQILCMLILEIIFWTTNLYINEQIWGLHDRGNSINIHLFATYFGLAISWIIEPPIKDNDKKSMYHSDIFSLFGTLFLVKFTFIQSI